VITSVTTHPPPETIWPSFRCLPLFVSGTPMRLERRDLAAERATALFLEKPNDRVAMDGKGDGNGEAIPQSHHQRRGDGGE
jgi:hypothetical protein